MSAAPSAVFLPLVAALLWVGLGGLASFAAGGSDRGSQVPRLLWPVLGFSLTVVLANSLSRLGIVLPWGGIIIAGLALAGLVLQRRMLLPKLSDLGWAAVAAGPVVLAFLSIPLLGGPTHAGFLADSSTGVHMLGADYLLHHGGDFKAVGQASGDTSMIVRYFVTGVYPSGSHALLGLMGAYVGESLLWVDTPLMGLCLGVAALATMAALRTFDLPRSLAAVGGLVASLGALAVAFALQGSIKEVVALPILAGMTAVALTDPKTRSLRSTVVQSAILVAALYSSIGFSSIGWGVAFVGFLALRGAVAGRDEDRGLVPGAKLLVGVGLLTAVLSLPLLPGLADQVRNTQTLAQSNTALAADPGNLLGEIGKLQAFGTWISRDHRVAPMEADYQRTYAMLGVSVLFFAIGLFAVVRERRWWQGLWLGGLIVLWYLLTERGTMWIDSKLVLLNGPIVALLMLVGLTWLARRKPESRIDVPLAALLVVPLLAGVAASAATLLQYTTLAPEGRYDEIERINAKFKGQGPILDTEFDEYAMYTLRDAHMTAPGLVETPGLTRLTVDGQTVRYGGSVSANQIPFADRSNFPLLMTMRSPTRTSPGSDWSLVMRGKYFDVYRRDPARTAAILSTFPVESTKKPEVGTCAAVRSAVKFAREHDGELVVSRRAARTVGVAPKVSMLTPDWAKSFGMFGSVSGDGRLVLTVPAAARAIDRDLWIGGSVGRPLVAKTQSGQTLGTFERLASGDGNVIGPVRVPAGTKTVLIEAGPRELKPGDAAPSVLRTLYLAAPQDPTVEKVPLDDAAAELCDRELDWVEVVRAGTADATVAAANAKP